MRDLITPEARRKVIETSLAKSSLSIRERINLMSYKVEAITGKPTPKVEIYHFCAARLARFFSNPGVAWGSEHNAKAFSADSPEFLYAALKLSAPVDRAEILIQAPDVAENGAQVPVEATVHLPRVQHILLIGERNLFPLLADIRVGGLYTATREVGVIVDGCLPG